MNTGDVSFYAGILLLFIGIIGGGIELKELKIPQITGASRYVCFASSLLCLVLGLYLKKELPGIPVTNVANTTIASAPASAVANSPQTQFPDVATVDPVSTPDAQVQKGTESTQPQIAVANEKPSENSEAVDEPQATSTDVKTINVANTSALNQSVASDMPKENIEAIVAKHHAQVKLDEANKRINIVWNATTQDIRNELLPEQRYWLKQRENDCSVQASSEQPDDKLMQEAVKLNCMAAMTDPRTAELKQEIADMESGVTQAADSNVSTETDKNQDNNSIAASK